MAEMPLYNLFLLLRRRGFPLGIDEYRALIDGLRQGIGTGSRADLIELCKLIWGKSEEEQAEIAELLATLLPDPLPLDALDQWDSPAKTSGTPPVRSDALLPPLKAERPIQDGGAQPSELPLPPQSSPPQIEFRYGSALGHVELTFDEQMVWTFDSAFDFSGSLPINWRQIKRAWRYYRRMVRSGPRTELNVDATIEQMHRAGVMTEFVLIPRRLNQARLLLLIDAGAHMIPFRHITQTIVEVAQNSFPTSCDVVYFQSTLGATLFADQDLSVEQDASTLVSKYGGAGVMIISDGGAAVATTDPDRATKTINFLDRLFRYTRKVAWLNPFPRDRWRRSTAWAIQAHVPMFTFERSGLDNAVNILRGKKS